MNSLSGQLFAVGVCVLASIMLWSNTAGAAQCSPTISATIDLTPRINGWGINNQNHRFIAESDAGITRDNLERLQVKWVFAMPDTQAPHTQPLITPDTVFIGDEPGMVYALDRDSGCEKWRFDAGSTARTALRLLSFLEGGETRYLLTFGTADAEVFGLDPRTGQQQWRITADPHSKAMVSGSAIDHNGVIYQPVSSWEAAWAVNPFYACCHFRSSILALDPASGDILWRSYTIADEPKLTNERFFLPDQYGPSGAPVWSQPALDAKRNRLYVGTGENYSSPATDTSDAIIAFDLSTGEMLWHQQFLAADAWNVACESPLDYNCPSERGFDLDFGAPPILVTVAGRDVILAGQKSGAVFALDPEDNGELLWQSKPGTGGKLGGVHFSMGVDESRGVLYVPISDRPVTLLGENPEGTPNPSLHAFDILSGKTLWSTPAPNGCVDAAGESIDDCHPGLSAAVTVTENLVFAPSLDGHIRVFDAHSGAYLDAGELLINAGYNVFDQAGGNAFIVMEVMTP